MRHSSFCHSKETVRINKALTQASAEPEEPKTRAGNRNVKLLSHAIEAIEARRQHTYFRGEELFQNPRTLERWIGDAPISKPSGSLPYGVQEYAIGIPTKPDTHLHRCVLPQARTSCGYRLKRGTRIGALPHAPTRNSSILIKRVQGQNWRLRRESNRSTVAANNFVR